MSPGPEAAAGRGPAADVGCTHSNKAQQVAAKYLSVRPGRRLQPEQRTVLLEEAVAIVGRSRKQPPRVDDDGFQFQRKQRQAEVQLSGSSPARESIAPAPIETSNRFQALQSTVDDVDAQPEAETERVQPEVRSDGRKRPGSNRLRRQPRTCRVHRRRRGMPSRLTRKQRRPETDRMRSPVPSAHAPSQPHRRRRDAHHHSTTFISITEHRKSGGH